MVAVSFALKTRLIVVGVAQLGVVHELPTGQVSIVAAYVPDRNEPLLKCVELDRQNADCGVCPQSVFWSQSDQDLGRQLASAQDDSMPRNCLLQS
jgi:hypothetical protein